MEHPMVYMEPVFYKMVEIDGPTQSLCLPRQFYMGNTDSMPPVTSFVSAAAIQPSEVLVFYQVGKNTYMVSIYSSLMVQRTIHPPPQSNQIHFTNTPSFYMFLHGHFMRSHILLPSLFVDDCKFIKGIDSIKLQNWSGRSWKVSIMREYGSHYMTNGWTEFKEQNNIKWQDMLTFHHIGKGIMRVSIFGPDECLKKHATPFNANRIFAEPHLGRRQPRCQNWVMDLSRFFVEQNGLEEARTVWLQNTLGDLWEVPMTVVNNNWTPRYYLEKFEWVQFIIDNDIGEGAILLFKVKPNSIIKVEVLGHERGEAMLQQSIRVGLLRQ
ncbi:hypothetical protein C2S52_013276 [Perilla frutescens var. hirtella]|nr:hypothetical protein C2S52_013276 [Perilla frutescens var. hirtella]